MLKAQCLCQGFILTNRFKVGGGGFQFFCVFSGEFLKIQNDLTKPASKATEKPKAQPSLMQLLIIKANFRLRDSNPLIEEQLPFEEYDNSISQSESPTSTEKAAS